MLLIQLQLKVMGFEILRKLYKYDTYFKEIWDKCESGDHNQFILHDGPKCHSSQDNMK